MKLKLVLLGQSEGGDSNTHSISWHDIFLILLEDLRKWNGADHKEVL